MNIARAVHDELSEELLAVSYKFDSVVGQETITPSERSQIRKIQSEILVLVEELRHEILGSRQGNGLVFSIEIRSKISLLKEMASNLKPNLQTERLLEALTEILAFPLSYLSGERSGIRDNFELTKREKDVMKILPRGLTAKAMASELFLTEATVKTHLAAIYRKLGVANRTQAIAVGLDSKLLTF